MTSLCKVKLNWQIRWQMPMLLVSTFYKFLRNLQANIWQPLHIRTNVSCTSVCVTGSVFLWPLELLVAQAAWIFIFKVINIQAETSESGFVIRKKTHRQLHTHTLRQTHNHMHNTPLQWRRSHIKRKPIQHLYTCSVNAHAMRIYMQWTILWRTEDRLGLVSLTVWFLHYADNWASAMWFTWKNIYNATIAPGPIVIRLVVSV